MSGMRLVTIAIVLVALASVIGEFAVGRMDAASILLALALPVYPVMLALRGKCDSQARMIATITFTAQPALLLYVFRGAAWQVDLHMIFFAALAMAATMIDWKAIIAGAAVVAVHHLLLGMAVPEWVFLGGGGFPRILMHAVILIAETVALVLLTLRLVQLLEALAVEESRRAEVAKAADTEREARSAELEHVIATVSDTLQVISQGNLAQHFDADLPPAYAALRGHFNDTLGSLRELIGSVLERAAAIRDGSSEIAATSQDLARRTESNAASLEQTTAAIQQLDDRLRAIAASAGSTVSRASEAISSVDSGRSTASDAVRKMNSVHESAKGIDAVIEGLDKIAFQTRVLAMNAAVEAGRAGEAGRGFAVVADLVSALAMRAEEEAKNARDQLSVTQADIEEAVGAVSKVDGSLAQIVDRVSEVHRLISGMADENRAQAVVITQISSAIGDMDRATQHNAAMVEESSAAAQLLREQGEMLSSAANRFQMPAAAGQRPRPAVTTSTTLH
ncbi:methyl-accepting chemotaxis protein [Stakelama tenebrarum]|nr:methyl-accepting chemotaxis protein [Sphingosinithalassobacter tenebrarum]